MIELLFRPIVNKTFFAIFNAGRWTVRGHVDLKDGERYVPFSPGNNLIKNGVVLFPTEPCIYGNEALLVSDVESFIHRYVDVSPTFEKLASYYVLLSWLYDAFNELPYLRLRGDFGTGKTRGLLVIGSICYKPFFASGASTISPIVEVLYLLEIWRGASFADHLIQQTGFGEPGKGAPHGHETTRFAAHP